MGIPSGAARYIIPAHGFVAQHDIFKYARLNMMYARFAVCGRRPFIKYKWFSSIAPLDAFLKNIFFAPKRQNALFNFRKQGVAFFLLIHVVYSNKKTAVRR